MTIILADKDPIAAHLQYNIATILILSLIEQVHWFYENILLECTNKVKVGE